MASIYPVFILLAIHVSYDVCWGRRRFKDDGPERDLYDDLTAHYDGGTRPVLNANTTMTVNFSLALHQLRNLDEKNQELFTHAWIYQEWIDELMQWDPQKYDGLETAILPAYRVWTPDLYIFNNAEKGGGFAMVNDSRIVAHHSGLMTWHIPLLIKSTCAVNVAYFPFDNQKCFIRFGSWIYDVEQLNLQKKYETVDMSQYVANNEYDMLSVSMERELMHYDLFEGTIYPQITVRLHLRRKPLYYAYTVMAPTLVLCILTIFTFLLPCDNGAKVAIGLTVFLSLYLLQLAIAENIPESNSLPLIGLFMTLVMTLNSISLVFATLVINIKKKGERKPCPEVPPIVLFVCKKLLARITCTRMFSFFDFYEICEPEVPPCCDDARVPEAATGGSTYVEKEQLTSLEDLNEPSTSKTPKDVTANSRAERNGHRNRQNKPSVNGEAALTPNHQGDCSPETAFMARHGLDKGVLLYSTNVRRHHQPPNRDLKLEWYFVAQVLDKTLFIIFFTAMMCAIFFPLVIIPYIHNESI